MRVLIIDDDRALRDALRRTLTLAGYLARSSAGQWDGGATGFVRSALLTFERELDQHVRHGRCNAPRRVVIPRPRVPRQ